MLTVTIQLLGKFFNMINFKELKKNIIKIKKKNKKRIVFTIGNTSKINNNSSYLTPIREFKSFIVMGANIYSEKEAVIITRIIDKYVYCVFVDCEKKIPKNISISSTTTVNVAWGAFSLIIGTPETGKKISQCGGPWEISFSGRSFPFTPNEFQNFTRRKIASCNSNVALTTWSTICFMIVERSSGLNRAEIPRPFFALCRPWPLGEFGRKL